MKPTLNRWNLFCGLAMPLFLLGMALAGPETTKNEHIFLLQPGKPFQTAPNGFSVLYPSEFNAVKRQYEQTSVKGYPVFISLFTTFKPDTSCSVIVTDFKKLPSYTKISLEGGQRGFVSYFKGTIDRQSNSTQNGHRVLVSYFHFPMSAQVTGYGESHLQAIGTRLFQVACIGAPESLLQSKEYQQFFRSFHIN